MKLILAIAALASVLASPAFAQAYDPREGTGNVLPFSYGPGSTRHGPGDPLTINSQGGQLAAGESGLYAFARAPRVRSKYAPAAISGYNSNGTVTEIPDSY
jgi:hypothetical protein